MKIYNLINSISSKQLTPNKNNSKAFCFFSKKIKIKKMNRLKTRVKNFINEYVLFHSSSKIKFEKETSFSKK